MAILPGIAGSLMMIVGLVFAAVGGIQCAQNDQGTMRGCLLVAASLVGVGALLWRSA